MFPKSIFTVDSHTAGMPTRVVVGGLPKIVGRSMAEKRDYVKNKMDYVRNFLCNEPRGHLGMFGAIITEQTNENADFGVIFSPVGYDDMCGHGTIGVVTVLIETGMVPLKEPSTNVTLETPAGLIHANAKIKDSKVKSVSFKNVPSFLYKKDVVIDVPGYGKVQGDVAFGGNWYFYIEDKEINIRVAPESIDDLIEAGIKIKNRFNEKFDLTHPSDSNISKKLLGVSIIGSPIKNKNANQNNIEIEGKLFDRSPCGTGTSGRMAVLFARNKLNISEDFINESIIGTIFRGKIIKKTKVGRYTAIIPEITGSAYITGFNHFVSDPDDPLGSTGFLLK